MVATIGLADVQTAWWMKGKEALCGNASQAMECNGLQGAARGVGAAHSQRRFELGKQTAFSGRAFEEDAEEVGQLSGGNGNWKGVFICRKET